jgi:hypothetical protein
MDVRAHDLDLVFAAFATATDDHANPSSDATVTSPAIDDA